MDHSSTYLLTSMLTFRVPWDESPWDERLSGKAKRDLGRPHGPVASVTSALSNSKLGDPSSGVRSIVNSYSPTLQD